MAALILPSRRVIQPQEPTTLRSEWQGRLIALSTPVGTLRKSGWSANSYTGSVPIGAGQFGRGFDLSPTGENKVLFSNADRPNTVVNRFYVVHATFKWRNTAAFGTIFGLYTGTVYVFTIGRFANGSLRCHTGGGDVFASGARYLEDGRDYTIAMTLGGSGGQGGEVYVNGVYVGKGSPAGPASTTRAPAIGALDGTTGFEYNGLVYSAGIWEFGEARPAQADLLSLTDNPFQIYKPIERRVWVPVSAGGAGNASGSLAGLVLSPASAGAYGAAQATATLSSIGITPAQASASGGASIAGNAAASLAALSLTAAQASASGAASASAALDGIAIAPSTASASGSSQASAALVALQIAPASATASGGASVPGNASATLASLSTTPATASASGAATAAGPVVGMNLTPAQAQAAGAAWVAAELRALSITPATATAGDSSGPGIDWSVTGARAIVPPATTRAIVAHFDAVAIVPAANTRAIVPASGDDMDPIKTVEQYRQDREVYEIDFGAKYLTQANDTAATLKAVGSDAGITVTPQVAVGGALSSGVVKLAVDDPTAVGDYKVWAQIATTAGRERTGVIVVRVEDL